MSDQRSNKSKPLVIAALIGVGILLSVIAGIVGVNTQKAASQDDPEYRAAVLERIKPFGQVAIIGEAEAADDGAGAVVTIEPVVEVMSGSQIYNAACVACHGPGLAGAPAAGDAAAWAPRIAQGMDVLTEHAIVGYQGEVGYMPPKGGRVDLSDEEIIAALEYLIDSAR